MDIRLNHRFVRKFARSLIVSNRNLDLHIQNPRGSTIDKKIKFNQDFRYQGNEPEEQNTEEMKRDKHLGLGWIEKRIAEIKKKQNSEGIFFNSKTVPMHPQMHISSFSPTETKTQTIQLPNLYEIRQKSNKSSLAFSKVYLPEEDSKNERVSTEASVRSDLTENMNMAKNKFCIRTNLKRNIKHYM